MRIPLLIVALICLARSALLSQSLEGFRGDMWFLVRGVPYTLLPHGPEEHPITPRLSGNEFGGPMAFTINAAAGRAFAVSFVTTDVVDCGGRVAASLAPDALYLASEDTLVNPNLPHTVTCDAGGTALLSLGITVELSPAYKNTFTEVRVTCLAVDLLNGDSLFADASVIILNILGPQNFLSGEAKRLSRGRTYTLSPDSANGTLTPILNGGENGQVARFSVEIIEAERFKIEWLLPTALRSSQGAILPCSFASDAGLIQQTGQRFDPHADTYTDDIRDCRLTVDLGMTVTVPADASPGEYVGTILGSLSYIGNAKEPGARVPLESFADLSVTVAEGEIPERATLLQNYPNPFNGPTTIRYALSEPEPVSLEIYDLLGRKVATLVHEFQYAGWHQAVWSAGENASGVYLYRLTTPSATQVNTLLLTR